MIKCEKNADKKVIKLPASCDIRNIDELFRILNSTKSESTISILDCSSVESADFSFVQLVVSAAASLGPEVARFELRAPTPCIRQAFGRAGLGGLPCLVGEA
jgi:anti-anti-sigma regulatory factor